ncbi:MAG: hypothetical protein ACLTC4_21920 [Hungatella hathewayi]
MSIDEEGNLWVAMWAAKRCPLSSTDRREAEISTGENVSCVTFGDGT